MIFGERIAVFADVTGIPLAAIAKVAGVGGSNSTKWRTSNGPKFERALLVAEHYYLSMNWLSGLCPETERFWSPRLSKAREELRKRAATHGDVRQLTQGQRLGLAWLWLQDEMDGFREEVWIQYLRSTGTEWSACHDGHAEPNALQIMGASSVTGLPELWLLCGDIKCLEGPAVSGFEPVSAAAVEEGLTPEEAIRRIRQK